MNSKYYHTIMGYELDSFGHVNNAVYLNYLEAARWKAFKEMNAIPLFEELALFPVILETEIRYIHELKIFDEILVETEWECNTSIITNKHKIYIKDNKILAAKAKCKLALISRDRVINDIPKTFIDLIYPEVGN